MKARIFRGQEGKRELVGLAGRGGVTGQKGQWKRPIEQVRQHEEGVLLVRKIEPEECSDQLLKSVKGSVIIVPDLRECHGCSRRLNGTWNMPSIR